MGILKSGSSKEKEYDKNSFDITELVAGSESVVFSCRGNTEDDRKLVLTEKRIIIEWDDRGTSIPISEACIDFEKYAVDEFRITLTGRGTGIGIRVNKSKFEEFWNKYSEKV